MIDEIILHIVIVYQEKLSKEKQISLRLTKTYCKIRPPPSLEILRLNSNVKDAGISAHALSNNFQQFLQQKLWEIQQVLEEMRRKRHWRKMIKFPVIFEIRK